MSTLPLPIAAFLAGLVSFLSPCVLPLVPGYVSLISGAGVEELKAPESRLLSKVMLNSIGFILGFSVVFITLGAISTEVGQLLARYKSLLAQIAGVVDHPVWIASDRPVQDQGAVHGRAPARLQRRQHAVGSVPDRLCIRLGWTPCVGPILGVILTFAAAQDSVTKGIFLLAIYSMGLAVPFLLTSLGIERFLKFYSRFRMHMHALEVASGGLLIALGILLVIGRFTIISNYLSFLNRFAL